MREGVFSHQNIDHTFDAVSSVKMLFRRSLVPVRSLLKLDLVVTNVGQMAFLRQ